MTVLLKIIIITYLVTWFGTWFWIKTLKSKSKQIERIEGPPSHKAKEGTPTMGGIVFILAIIFFSLIFIKHLAIILPIIFLILSFTILGLIDDFLIVKFKSNKGIRPRTKFLLQLIFSAIFIFLLLISDKNFLPTSEYLTYFINNYLWLYLIFVALVITGTANAVNLSDGLDGLAGGVILPGFIFFAWKALALNQPEAFLFLIISSSAVLA
jgi:phospho-N-acetylmuramoyl-pentapeptide-transferase